MLRDARVWPCPERLPDAFELAATASGLRRATAARRIREGMIEMHALLTILVPMLLLTGTTAQAQELKREQAVQRLSHAAAQTRREATDRLGEVGMMADVPPLLKTLRDSDEDTRHHAEQAIWRIWARSGNQKVDALYQTGIEQMDAGELQQAIVTFSRIIEIKPDFAEGWNKRATLYFLAGDLHKSLADCDEVMKRNPYHFGALSGYALIYTRLEYYDRALEYSRRALEVNPNLDGVRRNIDLLEHLLEQRRRQMI
jgi:tetratricopeptide (TPR) repeat protein